MMRERMDSWRTSTGIKILTVLMRADAHAYAIAKELAPGKKVKKSYRLVHSTLQRLVQDGVIKEKKRDMTNPRAPKIFTLTDKGRKFVENIPVAVKN